ncbi:TetR/AcrR family transcriptional regulator [Actinospica robiniae]|uniref:TetR/AcrR family transcriptional regulator n=1 Tax=Actinospica robiniae TaxID=304901 RepID=UPI00040BADE8|nr:TetR/AcrR family transcriptional regulator [Actinospica robiniae]
MSTPAAGARADAVRNRALVLDAAVSLLATPGAPLTVDAVAKKAGVGAGTVVRAFGGKDALVDAAVSRLLEPVVSRARDLLAATTPYAALRAFLGELMAFQASYHPIGDHLGELNQPATTALRAELVAATHGMIEGARRDGEIRTDLDGDAVMQLIGETAFAIARSGPLSAELTHAYLSVLFDGLRPQG